MKYNATEILTLLEQGYYHTTANQRVDFSQMHRDAIAHTKLYTPENLKIMRDAIISTSSHCESRISLDISVVAGTTQKIAHQLCREQSSPNLLLLNFASARNPGGGFLNGARAQEEDLCRCSGLYPTLLTQPHYYQVNREQSSMIYTDHTIYSPHVPFLKIASKKELLDQPFMASVVTMPAPNTGPFLQRKEGSTQDLETAFLRRWRNVIAIAHAHQHTCVLLGAWGCGAFQGDAHLVASMAKKAITQGTGCIEKIVFAIPDKGKVSKHNFSVFYEYLHKFNMGAG